MIISHRHRFIFIHCRKTAGSPIAAILSKHLGPDDLHLGTWPAAFNQGILQNRRAKLDFLHPLVTASYLGRVVSKPLSITQTNTHIKAFNGAQRLKYRNRLGPSPEHALAEDIRAFAPEAWSNYFKFCFVRNPYERALSDYIWRTTKRDAKSMSFLEFLQRMQRRDFSHPVIPRRFDNWPMYTIDNKIAVDFIGRFENLEHDLQTALAKIGLPTGQLPQENKQSARKSLSEWYGDKERKLVEELFANELDYFDYRMEDTKADHLPASA